MKFSNNLKLLISLCLLMSPVFSEQMGSLFTLSEGG